MLLTPHILVGAAIGSQFNNLLISAPLAAISHVVLDSIPHWDPHVDIDLGVEDLEKKDILVLTADVIIGATLITVLAALMPNPEIVWISGFCAALPDAQHVFHAVFGDDKLIRWKVGKLHDNRFNWDKDTPLIRGLIVQTLISVAAFAFVVSQIV